MGTWFSLVLDPNLHDLLDDDCFITARILILSQNCHSSSRDKVNSFFNYLLFVFLKPWQELRTLLHAAVTKTCFEIQQFLVNDGADIESKDKVIFRQLRFLN